MQKWISVLTLCLVFLSANAFAEKTNEHNQKNNHSLMNEKSRNRGHHFFYPWISEPETNATILPKKYVVVPNRSDSTLSIMATPSRVFNH